jgi:diguanylate cyclase (GGDEF)-like protein/PAS domain S-box-containing protein
MRQTLLLNIAIFGFFVFLFSSLYSRAPLHRLKFWIGAWIWVFLHFVFLMGSPGTGVWAEAAQSAGIAALLLCGVWFLISAPVRSTRARNLAAVAFSLCSVAFSAQLSLVEPLWSGSGADWRTLAFDLLLQVAGLVVLWLYRGPEPVDRKRQIFEFQIPCTLLIVFSTLWGSIALVHSHFESTLGALLMEMFACYALQFRQEFSRYTVGSLTTVLGLIAWAAVFPASIAISAHWPGLAVEPELWDVPKVFVAFGMLVTLLEDEQGRSEREREQYQALFDCNPLAMWIFEPGSTRLTEANFSAVRDFGWSREEISSMTVGDLISGDEASLRVLLDLNKRLKPGRKEPGGRRTGGVAPADTVSADAIRLRTRDGSELVAEATMQRIRFRETEARLLMVKDVTAQVEAREQLVRLANHDPLTGLPNRLLLEDRMQAALANAARHRTRAAILCMDLDRFKKINDTFGHAVGDSCLREAADRLRQRLRATDTAARVGGEEFLIVLDDVRNLEDAERVACDVLEALAVPHHVEGAELRMSASIGIAVFPDDAQESAALWSMADAAMYRAKQRGGHRHLFFSEGD